MVDKETEDSNDSILNDLLQVDIHNIDEQPSLLRNGVEDIREDIVFESANRNVELETTSVFIKMWSWKLSSRYNIKYIGGTCRTLQWYSSKL